MNAEYWNQLLAALRESGSLVPIKDNDDAEDESSSSLPEVDRAAEVRNDRAHRVSVNRDTRRQSNNKYLSSDGPALRNVVVLRRRFPDFVLLGVNEEIKQPPDFRRVLEEVRTLFEPNLLAVSYFEQ